jgi:thiol-disulfide isomerase/thioredoxin
MRKSSVIIVILVLMLSASCSQSQAEKGNYIIEGTIKNYTAKTILLNELTPRGLTVIDSAKVDEATGKFQFNRKRVSQPTFAVMNFNTGAVVLVLDSGANITISIDANTPEAYGVSGSADNEEMRKLILENNKYMKQVNELETKYRLTNDANLSPEMQMQIRQEYETIMRNRDDALRIIALTTPSAIVPYFVTNFLMPEADYEFFAAVDEKLYVKSSRSKYAQELRSRVNQLKATAIGQQMTDIILEDPYGKTIALSSLRGKFVLVDFWASWCGPCRRENPNVVKLYNKYKDKGFDIYSVSLDDNKDAWMRAINADQLLWPSHVSDLKKWASSVVPQFNIEGIPFTVLLDAEGRIIAKNLRGQQLEDKLKEIFNF